jgi:hypothetical protein
MRMETTDAPRERDEAFIVAQTRAYNAAFAENDVRSLCVFARDDNDVIIAGLHAFLDTLSFQALGFYQKLGYIEFGRLSGFSGKHDRYWLRKSLAKAAGGASSA